MTTNFRYAKILLETQQCRCVDIERWSFMAHSVVIGFKPSQQDDYPHVTNAPTEQEVQLITEVIQRLIPENPNILGFDTLIVRTVRHQCKCCYPILETLVQMPASRDLVRITIGPKGMGSGPSRILVERLTAETLNTEVLVDHPITAPLHPKKTSHRYRAPEK